jgi:uncharacterized membrane protein YoaK (UPF0700 family)
VGALPIRLVGVGWCVRGCSWLSLLVGVVGSTLLCNFLLFVGGGSLWVIVVSSLGCELVT